MAYVKPYGSTKTPISAHPVFPAIVALWFAALFGLGSVVLPNILVERIITMAGIDSLIPTAAPPLGATARFSISGFAAIFGALLGYLLARRVASAQSASRPARVVRNPAQSMLKSPHVARRPISATEELGSTNLETPAAHEPSTSLPGRRRSLAMAEDNRPSTYLQEAPLPGTSHETRDLSGDAHPMMPSMEAVANRQAAEREGTLMRPAEETDRRETEQPTTEAALDLANYEQDHAAQERPAPAQFAPAQPDGVEVAPVEAAPAEAARGENPLAGLRNPSPTMAQSPQTTASHDNRTHFERQELDQPLDAQDFSAPPAATRVSPAAQPGPAPDFSRPAQAAAPRQEFAQPEPEAARQEFAPEAQAQAPAEPPRQEFMPSPEPATQVEQPVAPPDIPQASAVPAEHVQDFSQPSPMAKAVGAKDPLAPFRAPEFDTEFEDDEEDQLAAFGMPDFGKLPETAAAQAQPEQIEEPVEAIAETLAPVEQIAETAIDNAPPVEETDDQPLAFVAPSQAKASPPAPAEPIEIDLDDGAVDETPDADQIPTFESVEPEAKADQPPLEELGIIALAERLGRSLGKEPKASAPAPAPAPDVVPAKVTAETPEFAVAIPEAFLAEEALQDTPATAQNAPVAAENGARPFAEPGAVSPPAPVIPEALKPLPLDLSEFTEADLEDEDGLTDMASAERYSSLLAMKNPFRGPAEFVRIELPENALEAPEPAVVFPGQGPQAQGPQAQAPQAQPANAQAPAANPFAAPDQTANDRQESPAERRFDKPQDAADMAAKPAQRAPANRDETDRALRSALATLQRMSGAA